MLEFVSVSDKDATKLYPVGASASALSYSHHLRLVRVHKYIHRTRKQEQELKKKPQRNADHY